MRRHIQWIGITRADTGEVEVEVEVTKGAIGAWWADVSTDAGASIMLDLNHFERMAKDQESD